MSEIDVFSNPLAMHVFGCLAFGLIALQIEVANYVAKRDAATAAAIDRAPRALNQTSVASACVNFPGLTGLVK